MIQEQRIRKRDVDIVADYILLRRKTTVLSKIAHPLVKKTKVAAGLPDPYRILCLREDQLRCYRLISGPVRVRINVQIFFAASHSNANRQYHEKKYLIAMFHYIIRLRGLKLNRQRTTE
jgi:hypothetical protein